MTEFTPLAEAASSAVLLLFLGLPTAFRAPGFKRQLGKQSRAIALFVLYVGAWMLGNTLGIGAWLGSKLMWAAYVLTELWSPRSAEAPWTLWQSLVQYCDKRRFYQAQHAI